MRGDRIQWILRCMPIHLISVSPPLRVQVLGAGGIATDALLLAIRWEEEGSRTHALVASEHGGLEWVDHAQIERAHID
jgi:hypothetical protein